YHWSNTDNRIKHFLFTLPIDQRSNRHIFIFYFSPDLLTLPGLNLHLPRFMSQLLFGFAQRFVMYPLLSQDVSVLGHSQNGREKNRKRTAPEITRSTDAYEEVKIRKGVEYLIRRPGVDPKAKNAARPVSPSIAIESRGS